LLPISCQIAGGSAEEGRTDTAADDRIDHAGVRSEMVDALRAKHVARRDRMEHIERARAFSRAKRSPRAASTASGQQSPEDELTATVAPSLMEATAAAAVVILGISFVSRKSLLLNK
jgi:hypothetical protein